MKDDQLAVETTEKPGGVEDASEVDLRQKVLAPIKFPFYDPIRDHFCAQGKPI
ncbi:hypothetical protein M5D96_011157 [Drosophila gunungcola]|uniref:Uncharacterized protein n=1 Tax=Drosophila gunungcola TaxID=103775 RepID=A0A9P9YFK8_9MUSC|nr:hypothetical protein M5D96_011157 [Drosophila gunungcola]